MPPAARFAMTVETPNVRVERLLLPGARPAVLVGSFDNTLHCVDAAGGGRIWTYETDGPLYGAPLYIDVDGRTKAVRYIWVHHHEDTKGRMVLHVAASTSDGVAVQMPFVYGSGTTVGDWLDAPRRQDYGPALTPLDAGAMDRAVQLVVSLSMHLATTRAQSVAPRHESARGRIGAVGLPEPKDWVVARVTMPKEIGEAVRKQGASLNRDLTVRHVVRGHWRMQPYGTGRAQRRPTWIAPHWRGEGPEALTKTIRSGNPGEPLDDVKARLTNW